MSLIKVVTGSFVLTVILLLGVVLLGNVSDTVNKNIPEDSEWADANLDTDNSLKSASDIIVNNPASSFALLFVFLSCIGGGMIYLKGKF